MKLLSLTPFVLSLALLAPATAPAGIVHGGHAHAPIKWARGGHSAAAAPSSAARVWEAIQLSLRNSERMAYSQSSSRGYLPMDSFPPATDCSGYATWIERMGGANVPLSTSYSFEVSGQAVPLDPSAMRIGDVVVYSGHVEVYVGGGRTVGHGSAGVHWHAWNYRPVLTVRRFLA